MFGRHTHKRHHAETIGEAIVAGNWVAPESRDPDQETELAFHKVWLARQLHKLPAPARRRLRLPQQTPRQAAEIRQAVDDLHAAVDAAP
jgi:hypothetical protein